MEKLLYNVSQILGTTIIHSLWQGLLVYTLLQLVFLAVLGLSAERKHNLAMLALFSMVAWFGYTFYTEFNAYNWNPAISSYRLSDNISLSLYNTYTAAAPVPHNTFAAYKMEFFNAIKTYLPYIAVLYSIGLLINLGRLGLAWNKIRAVKRSLIGNLALQQRVNTLGKSLGIRKAVQLSFTDRIDGPCVIGFVKPILLLPVTISTQLSADEVEAILIHELSHIQSNDYLLNLLQQLVTVLLFFNPFAILINRIISTERENRCDDIVVQTTGDPLIYAQALLKLEETRQTTLTLALAATGKKYHLLTRIERIMKSKKPVGNFKHIVLAMVILAGSLGSISWLNPEIKDGKIVLKRTAAKILPATVEAPVVAATKNSTIPVKHKRHFTIVAADSTHLSQLIDTTPKVKKPTFKIVIDNGDGTKKEYTSVNDLPADARREFLQENRDVRTERNFRFNMDTARFADLAPNFKFDMKGIPKIKFDEMRAMIDAKRYKAKDMKKFEKDMKKRSEEMEKFYSSPEWKKKIADITKASTDYANKAKVNNEDWVKATQELTKQSMKFSQDFINSPEWKKYQDDIVKQALEVAKQAQNADSPEDREKLLRTEEKLRTLQDRINTRIRTQINIKKLKSLDKQAPEKPELPELPQRKERTERPEKPEKPEIPEKAEKPEMPETPKQ